VPYKEMRASGAGESSAAIRERVLRARAIQRSRGFDNAQIPVGTLSQAVRTGRRRRAHAGNGGAADGALRGAPTTAC